MPITLAFRLSRSKKIFNLPPPPPPPLRVGARARARVLADRSEIAKNKEGRTRRGIAVVAALPGQQTYIYIYIYTVVQKKRVRVRSSLLIFCRT